MPNGITAPGNALPPLAVPMKGLTMAAGFETNASAAGCSCARVATRAPGTRHASSAARTTALEIRTVRIVTLNIEPLIPNP